MTPSHIFLLLFIPTVGQLTFRLQFYIVRRAYAKPKPAIGDRLSMTLKDDAESKHFTSIKEGPTHLNVSNEVTNERVLTEAE
jgi:hypothetical protein